MRVHRMHTVDAIWLRAKNPLHTCRAVVDRVIP
jgi:hypothetical protein